MGLYLTLLPLSGPERLTETVVTCYDRLSFDQDYDIFNQLTDSRGGKPTIKAHPLPPHKCIEIHGCDGIKLISDDGYGAELTFVYAQQIKGLIVGDNASSKNKAIKAFIDALRDDTPIILLWH